MLRDGDLAANSESNRSVAVKPEVVNDLSVWSQELLSKTVWADECTSWYKNGQMTGKVTALHAGSAMHYRGMAILIAVSLRLIY